MGQKIHPKCFRLGITQNHLSNWFSKKTIYSELLQEDTIIRDDLMILFKQKKIFISDIEIERVNKTILVKINILKENLVKFFKCNLEEIEKNLTKKLFSSKKIFLFPKSINEKEKTKDVNLIIKDIIKKLENRYPFKRAMKETIRQCQLSGIKGIKIKISGRLNGAEIARSEWKREGRVPLQTLQAKIGYSSQTASTIYGILGVKVWVFLGEVTKK
jgi:small subunit ribosomal protein S3